MLLSSEVNTFGLDIEVKRSEMNAYCSLAVRNLQRIHIKVDAFQTESLDASSSRFLQVSFKGFTSVMLPIDHSAANIGKKSAKINPIDCVDASKDSWSCFRIGSKFTSAD